MIPIEVTPLRIVTLLSLVHDANVLEPIVVRLPGIVTDVREIHPEKADVPNSIISYNNNNVSMSNDYTSLPMVVKP